MPVSRTAVRLIGVVFVVHTEKSFRDQVTSNRNLIVFTIFRLIWNQTEVCLDLNQSENSKYNLILG